MMNPLNKVDFDNIIYQISIPCLPIPPQYSEMLRSRPSRAPRDHLWAIRSLQLLHTHLPGLHLISSSCVSPYLSPGLRSLLNLKSPLPSSSSNSCRGGHIGGLSTPSSRLLLRFEFNCHPKTFERYYTPALCAMSSDLFSLHCNFATSHELHYENVKIRSPTLRRSTPHAMPMVYEIIDFCENSKQVSKWAFISLWTASTLTIGKYFYFHRYFRAVISTQ